MRNFLNSGRMSTDGVVLLASQMVSGGTLTHEVWSLVRTKTRLGRCRMWR